MSKFGLIERSGKGLRGLLEKTLRFIKSVPFLNGSLLKEEDSNGDLDDYVTITHAQRKLFKHDLGRPVKGFLVIDVYNSASTYNPVIYRTSNLNDEPEVEFVSFYSESAIGVDMQYRIWIW